MNLDKIKIYMIAKQFDFMQKLESDVVADTGEKLKVARYIEMFLCAMLQRQKELNIFTFVGKDMAQPPIVVSRFENTDYNLKGWRLREGNNEISCFVSSFNDRDADLYDFEITDDLLTVKQKTGVVL